MTLQKLKDHVHKKTCLIRNIERFIHSEYFELLHAAATEDEKQYIELMVSGLNLSALKTWAKKKTTRVPETMSVADLRIIARYSSIPNYGTLSKAHLLSELKKSGVI